MAYDDLPAFLSRLEDEGELLRVAAEVDPDLELPAIAEHVRRKADDRCGPALMFEQVRGSELPVAANLFGSPRRVRLALDVESLEYLADRVAGILHPDLPEGWLETLRLIPHVAEFAKLPPKSVKSGLCQQVVKMGRDVDLGELPIPRCWPRDANRSITMGQLVTKEAKSGRRHAGSYPLEVVGERRLLVHWDMHQAGPSLLGGYREKRQQMPVAIVLGSDPALTYAAAAPLPVRADAYQFAGFLTGRNVELVRCRSVELDVPANAELVLEGYIDPQAEATVAGTLGSDTGYYDLPAEVPAIELTALTHRANPTFPAIIPGKPPTDSDRLREVSQRIFLPLLRTYVPEIADIALPICGATRHLLFVSIEKRYPQQAKKVMQALWSLEATMGAKTIVVVDAGVDVHNAEEVWFRMAANVQAGRDVTFADGPASMADHSSPLPGLGCKMGLDATRKSAQEGHPRPWPDELSADGSVLERVRQRWSELGLGE